MKCVARILLLYILFLFLLSVSESYAGTKANHNSQTLHSSGNTPSGTQTLIANLYAINADSTISMEDGNYEIYGTSYCNCVNWLEDAKKVSNLLENFAIERFGQLMSIECKQPIGTSDTIFYNMTQMQRKGYYLSLTASGLNHPNLSGFLQDSYTGTSTPINLNGNTNYKFLVNSDAASSNPDRFRIVFSTGVFLAGVTPVPVTFTNVKALLQNNNVAVQWQVDNAINVSKYEVEKSLDGVVFNSVATITASGNASSTYNWTDMFAATGSITYRIKETDKDGTILYSKIINVTVSGGGSSSISVYPNPIIGGSVNLQMENMPGGMYAIRLMNNFGQVIFSKLITHNKSSNTETIHVSETIGSGVYRLVITHPGNTVSSTSIIF